MKNTFIMFALTFLSASAFAENKIYNINEPCPKTGMAKLECATRKVHGALCGRKMLDAAIEYTKAEYAKLGKVADEEKLNEMIRSTQELWTATGSICLMMMENGQKDSNSVDKK